MSDANVLQIETNGEAETMAVAARLALLLKAGDMVALAGDLGAGKTRFVRGLAEVLGIDANSVASPTFVLMHEYAGVGEEGITLVHIDAYRLSGVDELEGLGWDELLATPDTVVAVEWAERIFEALPEDRVDVTIEHVGAEARVIEIVPRGRLLEGRSWSDLLIRDDVQEMKKVTSCRICDEATDVDSEFFPFCSSRCRLVDLGKWLGGRYMTSREMTVGDEEV